MEFYTAFSSPRPVRLPEYVRKWAWDSLHGKYGDEAIEFDAISMDDIEDFKQLPAIDRLDLSIRSIIRLTD